MQDRTEKILYVTIAVLLVSLIFGFGSRVFQKRVENAYQIEVQNTARIQKELDKVRAELEKRGEVADTLKTAWLQCTKNYRDLDTLYLEDDRRHVVTVEWYRGHATNFLSKDDFSFSNGLYNEWMTKQRASDVRYRETRETMDKDTDDAAKSINEIVD